jgi:hypothetical protein
MFRNFNLAAGILALRYSATPSIRAGTCSITWRIRARVNRVAAAGFITSKVGKTDNGLKTVIPAQAHYCPGYFQMKR